MAAQVRAWQQDAQQLRAALSGALQQPANPDLDPALIRQRLKRQSRRHLASAAVLLIAVSVGGFSGWQAREMTLVSAPLPMTDALQAYRLIAQQGILPADYKVSDDGDMQGWLDRYFTQANRLPDLSAAGFKPVSGRLLSTEQGPAAMVVYEDRGGHKISFYVRPPGPKNFLLPRGSRSDGELAGRVLVRRRVQLCDGQPERYAGGADAQADRAVLSAPSTSRGGNCGRYASL